MIVEYDDNFDKFVRIKKAKLEVIKELKGKKSIAKKLDEIIEFYLNKKIK